MKKLLLVVVALMLSGCVYQPVISPQEVVPVDKFYSTQLCSLAVYTHGELLNNTIAPDAVTVTDKGNIFTYKLGNFSKEYSSMPLELEKENGIASLTDSLGYTYAKGKGKFDKLYSVIHKQKDWVAVFNCKKY